MATWRGGNVPGLTPGTVGQFLTGLEMQRQRPRNPLVEMFLLQNPQAVYSSFISSSALNDPMRRYYQNRFSDIYGQYQGQLASEMQRTGELPALSFGAFLNQYPFYNKYMALPPEQRGYGRTRSLVPRTRFLNF